MTVYLELDDLAGETDQEKYDTYLKMVLDMPVGEEPPALRLPLREVYLERLGLAWKDGGRNPSWPISGSRIMGRNSDA